MDSIDKYELLDIEKKESATAFCDTNIAHNLAKDYFKTVHHILDFGNLDQVNAKTNLPVPLLFPPLH